MKVTFLKESNELIFIPGELNKNYLDVPHSVWLSYEKAIIRLQKSKQRVIRYAQKQLVVNKFNDIVNI